MRRVVSNSECCHLWAHKVQDWAKGPTIQFEGPSIYSYGRHFEMARHVTNAKGEGAVLLTTLEYSITTEGHKREVWRACNHLKHFHVPLARVPVQSLDHETLKNFFERYKLRVDAQIEKARKATKYGEGYCNCAQRLADQANKFAQFFGLRQRITLPADYNAIIELGKTRAEAEKARQKKLNAKQLRRSKVIAKQTFKEWKAGELQEIPPGYRQYLDSAKIEKARPEAEANYSRKMNEKAELWRNHQLPNQTVNRYFWNGLALLRLSSDGQEIETSLGARFPVDHGQRAYDILKRIRARGEEYHRNGHTVHVGHYAIDHLNSNGSLSAGCHQLDWEEVERLAHRLNWGSSSSGSPEIGNI